MPCSVESSLLLPSNQHCICLRQSWIFDLLGVESRVLVGVPLLLNTWGEAENQMKNLRVVIESQSASRASSSRTEAAGGAEPETSGS